MRKVLVLAVWATVFTAQAKELLTLYTSQPNQDAQQTVDAFMRAYPDIEVTWVRDGTTKLMTKLQAELQSGIVNPDVLLIADALSMDALKKDGRLQAYDSPEKAHFASEYFDPEGFYYGTKLINTGIVYHNLAAQKPSAWRDLADGAYAGQVTMPSPLYSGAAVVHVNALAAHPDLGWAYVQKLAENQASAQGGNGGVLKDVASGQKTYGVIVDYLAIREAAKGSPISFVYPEEGVSRVTEPAAIMKGAKNPQAAQKFVDFLLSEQGQQLVAEMGYLPARNGIASPQGFPPREDLRFLPNSQEDSETVKARFSEYFGKH